MDEAAVRAALKHYFDHSAAGQEDIAHEIYRDDAVLEFPQSGERFEGVANFREWRRAYPVTKVDFDVRRVRGVDDVWVVELGVRYDGGPMNYGVEILEFGDGLVARETIYVMDGWEAPEWRSQWWAVPPHPAGGT
jgi:ketosteroid isomerase-like protein